MADNVKHRFPNGDPVCCARYSEDQCPFCWAYWFCEDWREYEEALKIGGASDDVLHRAWHRWWDGALPGDDERVMPCLKCPDERPKLQLVKLSSESYIWPASPWRGDK